MVDNEGPIEEHRRVSIGDVFATDPARTGTGSGFPGEMDVYVRSLECIRCGKLVRLIEITDEPEVPERFVCGEHLGEVPQ